MAANYRSKAKDSFKTKLRFFKFECVLNKTEYTGENFKNYNVSLEFVNRVTGQYYQWLPNNMMEDFQAELTVNEVFKKLSEFSDAEADTWFEHYFQQFPKQFPEDEFRRVANADKCEYCGITLVDIERLADAQQIHKKYERGYSMEIDRKHPNLEYTSENCVPACYWCNNAKTDEFTADEFKPIGELIGKTLKSRLNK